jgi:hypothetical protein
MNRHKIFLLATALTLAVGAGASAFAQPIATVSVLSPATAKVGNAFTVDVDIANVNDLYAWQFDLAFVPGVVSANPTGPSEGPFLKSGGATFFIDGTVDNLAGIIANNADTLLTAISGVSGSGELASFDFDAIGAGTSTLNLQNVILLNSQLDPIADTLVNGSITVTGTAPPVPENSTATLLGLGLLALGFVRRRPWRLSNNR